MADRANIQGRVNPTRPLEVSNFCRDAAAVVNAMRRAVPTGNARLLAAGPYTEQGSDNLMICTAGTFTINLLPATGTLRQRTIKNLGAGTITLDASGTETIDGATTQTVGAGASMTIVDYGVGVWAVI